jgi:hypothetical protein
VKRQLQVLKGYGDNAVVASICPRNLADAAASDFGYRPALPSLLERIEVLSAPSPCGPASGAEYCAACAGPRELRRPVRSVARNGPRLSL